MLAPVPGAKNRLLQVEQAGFTGLPSRVVVSADRAVAEEYW
jgi:hypothetical protein